MNQRNHMLKHQILHVLHDDHHRDHHHDRHRDLHHDRHHVHHHLRRDLRHDHDLRILTKNYNFPNHHRNYVMFHFLNYLHLEKQDCHLNHKDNQQ